MTMQAIKISEATIPLILATEATGAGDVKVMAEFLEEHDRYFIMNITDIETGEETTHWDTCPEETFWDWFTGDKEKAETEFVEVVRAAAPEHF